MRNEKGKSVNGLVLPLKKVMAKTHFSFLISHFSFFFLLVLFWGTSLLVVFRRYHYTAEPAGVAVFAWLSLLVAGTILLLAFLQEGRFGEDRRTR